MKEKMKILFLCTGNSCRSQMAEGFAKHLKKDAIDAYSAGTKPKILDPLAVEVMREAGIDISPQHPKHVQEFKDIAFDTVITLCGSAKENCPRFPGKVKVVHHGFADPPQLAENASTKEEKLSHYRIVRDQIKDFVEKLPEILSKGK